MSDRGKTDDIVSVSFLPDCKHKSEGLKVVWCRKEGSLFHGGPCSKRCLVAETGDGQ